MVPTYQLLKPVVDLRLALQQTRDAGIRSQLRAVETQLREQLGPRTPKGVAAQLLGVSDTALDKWIKKGYLPAVLPHGGGTRLGVETLPLLELATEVGNVEREDILRGRIARAVRKLGWVPYGKPYILSFDHARLPRPNMTAVELRYEYLRSTPAQRVAQLASLNRSLSAVAQVRPRIATQVAVP